MCFSFQSSGCHARPYKKSMHDDDWETTPHLLDLLQRKWGNFTLDCFADTSNRKTQKFYSKYHCPETLGVNAFLYSWANEFVYLVPPVYLVGKVLKHLRYFRGKGVLVVPYWVSATFWIYLQNERKQFHSFVKDFIILHNTRRYIQHGKNMNCFIGSPSFRSRLLALSLDFTSDDFADVF